MGIIVRLHQLLLCVLDAHILYDRKEELSIRFELFSYRIQGFKPHDKELKNMQFDKKSIRIIFSHFAITEDERMGSI